jgi:hypothetical protein
MWSAGMDRPDIETQSLDRAGPAATPDVRSVVAGCFEATAEDQERMLEPLSDKLLLLDSGLDSLCFAIIVAQLEDQLGVDPFSELDDAFFPVTFGQFVQLYEAAVEGAS